MSEQIDKIAKKIASGGKNIIFTGAGISTESGISDYRSKGGVWDRYRPVYFDEFMSSKDARIKYWQQKIEMYAELDAAKPNDAHLAVAELYRMGLVDVAITQNIDGLHQEAGIPDEAVIELHGNTRRVRCMHCDQLFPLGKALAEIQQGNPAPDCICGGYLKPDTISFGQSLREKDLRQATELSKGCDVFVVVGSTLMVTPASLMPQYALDNGAFLAVVNLSDTPYDQKSHVVIRGQAGEALSQILARMKELRFP
jgi:NAD-dependent deacetylase